MHDEHGIPRIATLLSAPARLMILWSLIDGTRRPAGELAYAAHISAQSASGHLAKLVDGGLLSSEAQGWHRYYPIASWVQRSPRSRAVTPQGREAFRSCFGIDV